MRINRSRLKEVCVNTNRSLRADKPRQGYLIFAVLVCLSVISLILIGSLTHSLRLHRQIRNERILEQTRWLLDAGVSRAVNALRSNLNYSGEIIELEQPLQDHNCFLQISVERLSPDKPILVNVVATVERIAKTAVDPAYQRSTRFEYFSN